LSIDSATVCFPSKYIKQSKVPFLHKEWGSIRENPNKEDLICAALNTEATTARFWSSFKNALFKSWSESMVLRVVLYVDV